MIKKEHGINEQNWGQWSERHNRNKRLNKIKTRFGTFSMRSMSMIWIPVIGLAIPVPIRSIGPFPLTCALATVRLRSFRFRTRSRVLFPHCLPPVPSVSCWADSTVVCLPPASSRQGTEAQRAAAGDASRAAEVAGRVRRTRGPGACRAPRLCLRRR